ncbi:uncharacterized protein LOC108735520 [Agrilus planipennis]|uniref:Uncharacterized protein LOC108735520 n=1 Tax=Agrilus planipennis TaxID=224129 RepID=A0A7F5RLX2_AGRPL|nr:uncharacterized protein LOC108735520 [Agrilus planipennis]
MLISFMTLIYYALDGNCVTATTGGLKWVKVTVPQFRAPGEPAMLECDYDLGNDTLYSVKWYKDHEEFYRFVRKTRPPAHSFKVEGVEVDMDSSNSTRVFLRSVSIKTSGLFRCEVSAEKPSFSSAQAEARMEVLSLPKEDPQITGVQDQYQVGDEINLNCTSGKSHPAPVLLWFINGNKVTGNSILVHYPPIYFNDGLVSMTLGLRFTLSSVHFQGGLMKVKCIASVSPVLWRGDRESIVQSLPIKDMREALLLVTSSKGNLVYPAAALIFICFTFKVVPFL